MNEVSVQENNVVLEEEVQENGVVLEEEVEREYMICARCCEVIEEWDSYFEVECRHGSEIYCEACFNNHCFRCADCGYNYPLSARDLIYRGGWICDRCSGDFHYCESCDSNVHYTD